MREIHMTEMEPPPPPELPDTYPLYRNLFSSNHLPTSFWSFPTHLALASMLSSVCARLMVNFVVSFLAKNCLTSS